MPIVFAQPSPFGGQTSVNAGAADTIIKGLPSMAGLYEAAMRNRSGGGGGGGVGYSGGPVQVLPTSDYGATAQVEAQANREQRTQDLNEITGQPDYVGRHIQQRQQFQLQQQQLQAQQMAQLNGQQNLRPPQQVPEFSAFDQKNLDTARQQADALQAKYEAGELSPDDPDAQVQYAQTQQKISALQQKQQAAQQFQTDQALQQQTVAQAHQDAQTVTRIGHLNKWMPTPPDQIPGMPPKHWKYDQHGVPVVDNEKERIAYMNHYYAGQLKQMDIASKQEVKQEAFDPKKAADAAKAEAEMNTPPSENGKPDPAAVHKEAQRIYGTKKEEHEVTVARKQAVPQAVDSFQNFVESAPRNDKGGLDLEKASTSQIFKYVDYLKNHRSLGLTDKEYRIAMNHAQQALAQRVKSNGADISGPIAPPGQGGLDVFNGGELAVPNRIIGLK